MHKSSTICIHHIESPFSNPLRDLLACCPQKKHMWSNVWFFGMKLSLPFPWTIICCSNRAEGEGRRNNKLFSFLAFVGNNLQNLAAEGRSCWVSAPAEGQRAELCSPSFTTVKQAPAPGDCRKTQEKRHCYQTSVRKIICMCKWKNSGWEGKNSVVTLQDTSPFSMSHYHSLFFEPLQFLCLLLGIKFEFPCTNITEKCPTFFCILIFFFLSALLFLHLSIMPSSMFFTWCQSSFSSYEFFTDCYLSTYWPLEDTHCDFDFYKASNCS